MVFVGLIVVEGVLLDVGGDVVLGTPVGLVVSDETGGRVTPAPVGVIDVDVDVGALVVVGRPTAGTTLVGEPTTTAVTTGAKTGTAVDVVVVVVGGIVTITNEVVVIGGAIVSMTTVWGFTPTRPAS
jgi:hypothetical protein